jgi:uncharacterized protein
MLNNKRVWITGAGSGIGAEVARQLAQRGAIPILTGRDEAKLQAAADSIGGRPAIYRLDVTDNEQVRAVAGRIIEEHGGIDVLLNNAGFGMFERFEDAPLEHFEAMMDTNYMGIVRCTQAVLPQMRKQGSGQIVNVASIAGKLGTPKSTGYSASKHAVLGLTNALRMELKGTGIAVSAVNPGPIDTPFFEKADPEGNYVRNVRWFMMTPERVAREIVKVIDKRKAEVDLPFTAAFGVKLVQLFPTAANKLAGRLFDRK